MQETQTLFQEAHTQEKLSISGRKWILLDAEDKLAAQICQRFNLSAPVGTLLAQKRIPLAEIEDFLNPRLKTALPDPMRLNDMNKAVARVVSALVKGEKIAIFGDYDVDGATSSALLYRFLKSCGMDPCVYIPDRVAEGYGPNVGAIEYLQEQGAKLIVFLDCGTTANSALDLFADAAESPDFVIIDHHKADTSLPQVHALVNPNRQDEQPTVTDACGHMAAAGLTFLFLVALKTALDKTPGAPAPTVDLLSLLDLVALGTVCDVVPLTGINRAFVAQGLKVMNDTTNCGLRALMQVTGLDLDGRATSENFTPYHLGFVLGPRLNAGGRVGGSNEAVELLTCEDFAKAMELATVLDQHNMQRKNLERQVLSDAMAQGEAQHEAGSPVLIAAGDGWHPGVTGIVASRVNQQFYKPACVITFDENDMGKGSCRSIDGVDIGALLIHAHEEGLLENGGGHEMAGGLTIRREKLPAFTRFLTEEITASTHAAMFLPQARIHAVLPLAAAGKAFADEIARLAPFGQGNKAPRFMLKDVRVTYHKVLKNEHLALTLQDHTGQSIRGICFRVIGTPLGEALQNAQNTSLHIVGQLKKDHWQGREEVKFFIEDAMWG